METKYSTNTSVDFQRITLRYIPEHRTLKNHLCEKLKSNKKQINNKKTNEGHEKETRRRMKAATWLGG
jgi:hypothetical protein